MANKTIDSRGIERKVFSVSKENIEKQAETLYQTQMPFMVVASGNSYEINSDKYNSKSFDRGISPKDLGFIRSVKSRIVKGEHTLRFIDTVYRSKKIHYIDVNPKIKSGDIYTDVCCIDINNAYWQTALLLGLIDHELYEEGLKKEKLVRLTALGSLAKKKDIYKFDGKKYEYVDTIRSTRTENIWFLICYTVAELMQKISKELGEDFIFYWVDGIYFVDSEENRVKVQQAFSVAGYGSKQESLSSVEFEDRHFFVYSMTRTDVKKFGYRYGVDRSKVVISSREMKRLKRIGGDIMNGKKEYRVKNEGLKVGSQNKITKSK